MGDVVVTAAEVEETEASLLVASSWEDCDGEKTEEEEGQLASASPFL